MSSTSIVAEIQQTLDGLDSLLDTMYDLAPFESTLAVEALDNYMMVVEQRLLASISPIPVQYQPRFLKQIIGSRANMKITLHLSTTVLDNLVLKMLEKIKEDAAKEVESGKSRVRDDSSQIW